MKYNDNGEYKEIVVKSFDTLPVGTEVDFDGNEVPSGWTETDKTYKSETYSLSGKTVTAGGSIELGVTPTISGKTFIGAFIKNGVSIAGLIGTIIDKRSSKIYLLCSKAQTFGSTSEVTITYMYADSKKIKKTSQYIEGGASLSNVYGTSQSNGYTQDYINGLNTYSTDEVRIGTWIDGKPIYRKVLIGTFTNTTDFIVVVNNASEIVNVGGTIQSRPWNYFVNATTQTTELDIVIIGANINFRLRATDRLTNQTYKIILEYTKTTDTTQNTRSITSNDEVEEPIEDENQR